MKRLFRSLAIAVQLAVAAAFLSPISTSPAVAADPLDWPYWRGPEYNSISRETGLPDTIDPAGGEGSNLLWKRDDLGSRATPIVMNGCLYTITRANPATPLEAERVVCLDAATGKTIWESVHNMWSSDVPDTRVGWSSVVGDPETGNVYSLGGAGLLQCHNGKSGEILWQIPLHEQLGVLSTYGGRTNFPVIVDDVLIVPSVIINWGDLAVPAHRFLGFDKRIGEIRWFTSTKLRPEDTIYSAPTIGVFNGQKLLVAGSGDGYIYGIQPRTGKIVWEYELSRRGINTSPTIDGDTIYVGHSEENPTGTKMGAIAAIKGNLTGDISESGEIWKNLEIGVGKSSILKVGDRIYCPDDAGKLFIFDAKTGEQIGRKVGLGTMNFATPVYADGKIYHVEKNGRWYILTPDDKDGVVKPKRGETMGNFPTGDELWASPVISHGRLYIATTGAMYCFEDKSKEHGSTEPPKAREESPVEEDQKPAQVQVIPAEALMQPGESKKFEVRVFNAKGQLLKDAKPKVTFTVAGPLKVDEAKSEFVADAGAAHEAAIITAEIEGGAKTRSRVRIVPPLPWKFDFEKLTDAPITWVGARYRHQLRDVGGNKQLVKITTIPKGTRSRLSMGPSDLHDYTIQADVKAAQAGKGKEPDIGVIAQGYTLEIGGLNKRLMIHSWFSHDKRYFTSQDFELDPDVWYTMKLRASNQDGKAVLQGKVWKRDEKEPADWTIELVDPQPNKTGAPGLFGNATNAEIFIDNVQVTPNSESVTKASAE